jgi:hypothetical protein
MPLELPPEAAGLLAFLALVLLPGLAVVRAPWTVVPAVSVAFWVLAWWWVPVGSRDRVLALALVAFGLLASLRLWPRHVVPPPSDYDGPPPPPLVTGPLTGAPPRLRGAPSLVVVGVSLALLFPLFLFEHVPGTEMAFHTTTARVALWRDGLPATYQPLLPLGPFGAHPPALSTLAADVSLLSGLGPGRSVALVTLGSVGLLLLGLYALLATRLRPAGAALAVVLGLAAVRWPGFVEMWGEGTPLLGLGLGVSAAALLLGHASRPSAVAAGMLLAAAALSQPVLALTLATGLGTLSFRVLPRTRDEESNARRLGLALAVALVLAGPGLWRLVRALSPTEAWSVVAGLEVPTVLDFIMGLVLLVLVALLAKWLTDRDSAGAAGPRSAVLTGVGALLLIVRVTVGLGTGQLAPERVRQLEVLEAEHRPLRPVCAPADLIDWVPALAGRPPGQDGAGTPEPWVPPALREEGDRRCPRPCPERLD